jgi:hypothetical protein
MSPDTARTRQAQSWETDFGCWGMIWAEDLSNDLPAPPSPLPRLQQLGDQASHCRRPPRLVLPDVPDAGGDSSEMLGGPRRLAGVATTANQAAGNAGESLLRRSPQHRPRGDR